MPFDPSQYELLDFGNGRKLERFGDWVLDRPAPAAEGIAAARASLWKQAHARYERGEAERGAWRVSLGVGLPESWTVRHGALVLEIKPTPFGHVGLFPEQARNWDWIESQARDANRPLAVLNLFACTGGATLAAAAAGAEATHVDSSRPVVNWARRNAELSGLADAPIRWIVEDAATFVRRELNRGRRYDAVVLDPPSYGHGPDGQVWQIERDLPDLLANCAELTAGRRVFAMLSCHSPGYDPGRLRALLLESLGPGQCESRPMTIETADRRALSSGSAAMHAAG